MKIEEADKIIMEFMDYNWVPVDSLFPVWERLKEEEGFVSYEILWECVLGDVVNIWLIGNIEAITDESQNIAIAKAIKELGK